MELIFMFMPISFDWFYARLYYKHSLISGIVLYRIGGNLLRSAPMKISPRTVALIVLSASICHYLAILRTVKMLN